MTQLLTKHNFCVGLENASLGMLSLISFIQNKYHSESTSIEQESDTSSKTMT